MKNKTETKKNYPTGWHFHKEFVDIDGNVYHRGQIQPDLEGTLPTSTVYSKDGKTCLYPPAKRQEEIVNEEKSTIDYLQNQVKILTEMVSSMSSGQNVKDPTQYIVAKDETDKKFGDGVRSLTEDDFLEKNITFLKAGKGFVLSVYIKNGQEILAPYNKPIYFAYSSSDLNYEGDALKQLHFSEYTTNSKKEVEFIRNSPLYKVTIFENLDSVSNIDSKVYLKLEAVALDINSWSSEKVFLNALAHGLDKSKGVDALRKEFMAIRVQSLLNEERKILTDRNKKLQEELFANKD